MKRIALFTAALMILSFGLANAQTGADELSVTVGGPGLYNDGGTDYINPTKNVVYTFKIVVDGADPASIFGVTNGWNFYLANADGPVAGNIANPLTITSAVAADLADLGGGFGFDGGQPVTPFYDNVSPEMVGLAGFNFFKNGLPSGYTNNNYFVVTVAGVPASEEGNFLCVDTAFYPPGGFWLWSDSDPKDRVPYWNGPVCYEVKVQPDPPATITNCPPDQSKDHCQTFTYDFNGVDEGPGAGALTWSVSGGPGSIDPISGVYTLAGTFALIGTHAIQVTLTDAGGNETTCDFNLTFTNTAPTIACQGLKQIGKGNPIQVVIGKNNVDCDPGTFSIVSVTPAPVGTYSINANTGVLTFNTAVADGGFTYDFVVQYSDGLLSATCTQQIMVLQTEPFGIYIEKSHMSFQGQHEYIDVSVFKGSEQLWGFDLLIAYDASVLSFQMATPGDVYTECGWEYFTYRYGANGNCNGGCPSGLLRVVGIAETNNGANHPACFKPAADEYTLFTLDFLVSDNRTYECQYAPIRFFWLDCGDNALSYHEVAAEDAYSQVLGISRAVYDFAFNAAGEFDDELGYLIDLPATFPSWGGAIDECDNVYDPLKPAPIRFVDFYNGGVDIACADSIDARGDVNLDGQANTIADAVLLSNYFVYGMGVFTVNVQGQIAATDVNADGIALSVADLVYLIRVVVGDALPYPKLSPVTVNVLNNAGTLSVDASMGAALVVVEGQAEPTLLASGVEMKYAYDAAENVTRVLVVGMTQGAAFEGEFLQVNGAVRSIDMATYEGAPAKVTMPTTFALAQNYPNPFNPSTVISFTLPTQSDYTITVYNVTGQVVTTHSGNGQGEVSWTFNASDLSSGIYFYNVEAGQYSATKKMVLIK